MTNKHLHSNLSNLHYLPPQARIPHLVPYANALNKLKETTYQAQANLLNHLLYLDKLTATGIEMLQQIRALRPFDDVQDKASNAQLMLCTYCDDLFSDLERKHRRLFGISHSELARITLGFLALLPPLEELQAMAKSREPVQVDKPVSASLAAFEKSDRSLKDILSRVSKLENIIHRAYSKTDDGTTKP